MQRIATPQMVARGSNGSTVQIAPLTDGRS